MSKRKSSIDSNITHRKRTAIALGIPSPGIKLPMEYAIGTAPKLNQLAFRISNIPICITKDQFLDIIDRLHADTPPEGRLPGQSYQNLLAWSFAPPAASADAEKYRTATVTFKSIPTEFQYTGPSKTADFIPNALTAAIDTLFYGLTTLYSAERPTIDIVAVTGLAGHAFGSWKARGGSAMWLRDFLPEDLPNTRILTYGYNSALLKNNSTASIREFSRNFLEALTTARSNITEQRRPIVFIGHSLGGLVIKDALMEAAQIDGHHGLILQSCYALLLFGCPNCGLAVESLRPMVKSQANSKLIEDLDKGSNFLRRHNHFWKFYMPEHTRVISIYETQPTASVEQTSTSGWKRTGKPVLMVNRESAIHATPDGRQDDIFSIDADHSNIVKFDNNSCQDYINVRSKLVILVGEAQAVISQRCKEAAELSLGMPGVSWNLVRWTHVQFRGDSQEEKKRQILKWLSEIEYIKHHRNALEGILKKTGQWLLGKREFREWRSSGTSGILWLHGIPGSGKTKLTCMVIETLGSLSSSSESRQQFEPVVYFYCNRDEPARRDPTMILRAIVKQMSCVLPGLPKSVVAKFDERNTVGFASGELDFNESYDLLVSLLDLYPQTVIIIDALDEADPKKRGQLLDLFTAIIHSSTSVVKFFISSRDDIDIKLKLDNVPNLYIQARDNNNDIERFIDRELAQSTNSLLSYTVRAKIRQTLLEKAHGMFQWVNLQLIYLTGMKFEDDIIENLGRLPESLSAAYSQILDTIRKQATEREWDVTTKALMWIMCSRELLTAQLWTEMSYRPKSVPPGGAHILFELCRNLVAWDSESKVVRFSHLSVNEYLETMFSPIHANTMAAMSCLSLFDHILISPVSECLQYSARYWPDHVERCYSPEQPIDKALFQRLQTFLGTPSAPGPGYISWLELISEWWSGGWDPSFENIRNMIFHLNSLPPNPFFAIAYLPFGVTFQGLWVSDFDTNIRNVGGETLLFVASIGGNEWAVEGLLEKGANPNAGNSRFGRNPLVAAMRAGNEGIAFRLLRCGLSIDTDDGVLEAVARDGTATLFESILRTNPNTAITEPILMAVTGNSKWGKEMIEMLFARDYHITITEAVVTEAIGHGVCGGRFMKTILAVGRDITITRSALHKIVQGPDIDAIKMLIARHPNFEITDAILTTAASNRWLGDQVIAMLLAMDPNIHISESVLTTAAENPSYGPRILSMLLAHCLNPKITEVTVLAGVRNQYTPSEIVTVLLATDCEIEITENVLVEAAAKRVSGDEILAVLLASNPDITITEQILMEAAGNIWSGDKIMSVLLAGNPGIEISEQTLVGAAENSVVGDKVMSVLLARNPDIEITEQLVVGAAENSEIGDKVMSVLLARNPDIEITHRVVAAVGENWGCGQTILSVLRTAGVITVVQDAAIVAAIKERLYDSDAS